MEAHKFNLEKHNFLYVHGSRVQNSSGINEVSKNIYVTLHITSTNHLFTHKKTDHFCNSVINNWRKVCPTTFHINLKYYFELQ